VEFPYLKVELLWNMNNMDRACPKGVFKIDSGDISLLADHLIGSPTVPGCAILSYGSRRVKAIWGRGVEFADTPGYTVNAKELMDDGWEVDVVDQDRFAIVQHLFHPSSPAFADRKATIRSEAFANIADRSGQVAVCDARHRNTVALAERGFSADSIIIFEMQPLVVIYLRLLARVLFHGGALPQVVHGRLEDNLPKFTKIRSLYFDVCGGLPHNAISLADTLTVYAATCSHSNRSKTRGLDFEIRRPAGFTEVESFSRETVRCTFFIRG
jgi:hypothetical protein